MRATFLLPFTYCNSDGNWIQGIMARVLREGKHLSLMGQPFYVRGVTYGTFSARSDGELYPDHHQVHRDFSDMAALGINVVRTYTLPPNDVLDLAEESGLHLLVGVHYEDWRYRFASGREVSRRVLDAGRRAVSDAMDRCTGRDSVLAVAVGNEVPGDLVRLHGVEPVENTLSALIDEIHQADPTMLATYCNYPTTEYLRVENQDLCCFNVFLEQRHALQAYLRHLQVVAQELPLIATELGLASEVHGKQAQRESLAWQLSAVDECGCAGATVYAWTDDWAVGGHRVYGWGFGITDENRSPKPAAAVLGRWATSGPADLREKWPKVSVVVCAYNAADTIEWCLSSVCALDYPDIEIIAVDDGSTDQTAKLCGRFPVRLIRVPHGGLAAARNAGLSAATGDIVAYLDADAACPKEWLFHLALALDDDGVVAAGGPNLPVPHAGLIESAVAASPGNATHVLLSDDRAEHVPGCNMAFWKSSLQEISGFDPIYTAAGDDVDVCWKLLDRGGEIGFAAAADVLHHRRATVRGYLRQQRGYGRAEALLSGKHPHRFGRLKRIMWHGFIYGSAPLRGLLHPVVYHGTFGLAPFQAECRRPAELVSMRLGGLIPLVAIAAVLAATMAVLSAWSLLVSALCLLYLGVFAGVVAWRQPPPWGGYGKLRWRFLVGALQIVQPLARVWGRLGAGPQRRHPATARWSGDRADWLRDLERELRTRGCSVRAGREHERWDLEASLGSLFRCRITTALAHGWTPLWRAKQRPRLAAFLVLFASIGFALVDGAVGLLTTATLVLVGVFEAVWLRIVVKRSLRTSISESVSARG